MEREFIDATTFLRRVVRVLVDRPLGSRHPREGFIYPVNYGYIPGVPAPDGEDLDAYILGVFEPLTEFTGTCIAVIRRMDDVDDKLVVAPEGQEYSDAEILALTEFQERFFKPIVTRVAGYRGT